MQADSGTAGVGGPGISRDRGGVSNPPGVVSLLHELPAGGAPWFSKPDCAGRPNQTGQEGEQDRDVLGLIEDVGRDYEIVRAAGDQGVATRVRPPIGKACPDGACTDAGAVGRVLRTGAEGVVAAECEGFAPAVDDSQAGSGADQGHGGDAEAAPKFHDPGTGDAPGFGNDGLGNGKSAGPWSCPVGHVPPTRR